MTRPPPPDLLVPERPVRSEFARGGASREISYARRRLMTLAVLAAVVAGTFYALLGHHASNPADIPTIHAEGAYKQKPANPGGIDIPHQDVQVYNELEGKNAPSPQPEHLLPQPEMPKEGTAVAPPAATAPSPPPPVVTASPVALVPAPPPPKPSASNDVIDGGEREVKPVSTTVAPAPVPVPAPAKAAVVTPALPIPAVAAPVLPPVPAPAASPAPAALSIDQIIANSKAPAPAPAAKRGTAVQLASVSDQAKAQAMLDDLQKKYASTLKDIPLHLERADLGAKGIYYRIQSQPLAQEGAARLCSALKQLNAGCILVNK